MKRKLILIGMLVFILGLSFGILSGVRRLEASSAQGENSLGEDPPSVVWHEYWKATEGYVSSKSGYQKINISPDGSSSVVSGKIEKRFNQDAEVEVYPDMVVKKWEIHGHIHFR